VAGLAACAAACASPGGGKPQPAAQVGLTPTQNFKVTLSQSPDEILLAVHASGLSERQYAAIDTFVARWRDTSGHAVTIRAPGGDDRTAARMVLAIEDRLQGLGVAAGLIHVAAWDQPAGAEPAVALGFTHYQAEGPKCGRAWEDFTKTGDNAVNSNFGCANTANLAAMIANPADLAEPRPVDSADAARRETVLGKYRLGLTTSTARDPQAEGAVSNVVQ
jgi:pilus assembly protein CpaD